MKEDDFLDAGRVDLSSASPEFGNMRVANRAINEAPELQMHEAFGIGKINRLTVYGFDHLRRQSVARLEFHADFAFFAVVDTELGGLSMPCSRRLNGSGSGRDDVPIISVAFDM
jgi:hypothetical protein